MTVLTPALRAAAIQRVFWAGTRAQLREVERWIAQEYAANPEQRALNDEQLTWIRNAVSARRETVGRG